MHLQTAEIWNVGICNPIVSPYVYDVAVDGNDDDNDDDDAEEEVEDDHDDDGNDDDDEYCCDHCYNGIGFLFMLALPTMHLCH